MPVSVYRNIRDLRFELIGKGFMPRAQSGALNSRRKTVSSHRDEIFGYNTEQFSFSNSGL
jgi:hypothetical protein